MSAEVAKALISEARKLGLRATVHAPNLTDAKEAISDGATSLAHGVLEPFDEATIAVMKSRPVFYIPTMDIFEFLADTRSFVDRVLAEDRVAEWLAPATLTRYRSTEYSDGYRDRYPNFENVKLHLQMLRDNVRRLNAAGVPVALGTDMWAFPGLAVSIEMDLYTESGITPGQVIRVATRNAARSMGIDADRGTLEAGKRADLLVLFANPLKPRPSESVRAIDGIWKSGARVGPAGQRRGP
jgi:imidazolonepropionase-like amidohydrolase